MLIELWFDVGIKRYTTEMARAKNIIGCGLMQESKDIQQATAEHVHLDGCGLMQESKDIQPAYSRCVIVRSCGLMQESKDIQHMIVIDANPSVVV